MLRKSGIIYKKGEYMMRILTALLLISFTAGMVQADNLFPNNNPFGMQTGSPSLNNIYETTPQAIEQEKKTEQKVKKSKWWRVKEDIQKEGELPTHQRAEDSGFIIFK